MTNDLENNDLETIISQFLDTLKAEQGSSFSLEKVNLAEMEKLTGISRGRLRKIKKDGFVILPHGNKGRKAAETVLTGFTGVLDNLLRNNVTNSVVCYERLKEQGYQGSLTTVKVYISNHKDLIPPKRQAIAPQGSRGRRYSTGPGESYQMDWGFITVTDELGNEMRIACFAMVCHHCGEFYIEFFPNARQENLFIGMLHAFDTMGVPKYVLTDNMKSVVDKRDSAGHPLWNPEYESFMQAVGFMTKLCKPRHPFTKGAVERLILYVKGNFAAGRVFSNITNLNYEVRDWCSRHNTRYHKTVDGIPQELHNAACMKVAHPLEMTRNLMFYLCPKRHIAFDGFVNYDGRRFGVPYGYSKRVCRVKREDFTLYIYSDDLTQELVQHDVTWSRKDSFCENQFSFDQPEEFPTATITTNMRKVADVAPNVSFSQFNFDKEVL